MRLRTLASTSLTAAALFVSHAASALNPLEYADNGSTAFARGGAWLATATDPIAAHYNPAALATQKSGFDISLNAAFHKVCFDRRNPGNELTGPNQGPSESTTIVYLPACNDRSGFPKAIPALGVNWRASRDLAFGFAFVPPSAYTDAAGAWPEMQAGYNTRTNRKVPVPAPYRYMQTENHSLIFMPTLAVGAEVLPGLRVGAGFIWGIAAIDLTKFDTIQTNPANRGDRANNDDTRATLKTQDFFMPGAILSVHWSPLRYLDVAAWGRWLDAVNTTSGELELIGNYFGPSGPNRLCTSRAPEQCTGQAISNKYGDDGFEKFKYSVVPPEVRVGVRVHLPRGGAVQTDSPEADTKLVRDPLHDDVFDIELNGSYTKNTETDIAEVRFLENNGEPVLEFLPSGRVPPNADRKNGYDDTFGARLGGQYNAVQDKLALLAGTWIESQAAGDEYLQISPVPALRGGFGGGLILRQAPLDFVIGYQRHWSQRMDNGGRGALRANAGERPTDPFSLNKQPREEQFRTAHFINGGRLSQSAHVFTMGAVWRF